MNLTPDEMAAIEHAHRDGFYIRSGRTLAALLAWQTWCMANGVPAVVVAIGARRAFIEVDGVRGWSGPVNEAEQQARAIAKTNFARAI
jgi:hypothetical protein